MTARKDASNKDMNGLKVINLGAPTAASNDAARKVDIESVQTFSISRANHTGTQLAATISDFDTQVHTSRIDQLQAPTTLVSMNSQRLTNLAAAIQGSNDAVRQIDLETQIAFLSSGQTLKGTVRAVAATNVNLASAPATIDGVTPTNGDVFLLAGQTTGSQNGPYVWTATGATMARAQNWSTTATAIVGSYWIVLQGTQADKFALMTNDTFTLNTTTAAFIYVGVTTAATAPVEQDCGNGAATSFAITHSFGTRAVNVMVYRVASPFDEVDVYVEHTDLNTVTLKPDAVWATNEFHAVVSKM